MGAWEPPFGVTAPVRQAINPGIARLDRSENHVGHVAVGMVQSPTRSCEVEQASHVRASKRHAANYYYRLPMKWSPCGLIYTAVSFVPDLKKSLVPRGRALANFQATGLSFLHLQTNIFLRQSAR